MVCVHWRFRAGAEWPALLPHGGAFRPNRSLILAAQLLVGHGGNFNAQVDAIEQRSAALAQVTLDDRARATTLAPRV